jgi:hypothetical protein
MASEKKGSSSTTKVLVIVLVGGGLAVALCCGGVFWFGKSMFDKVMITDPAAVRTRAAAIADITIPQTYEPQMAMDMSAVGLPMTMCMFARGAGEGAVMLMEMSGPAGSPEQMKQQFQQGMQQQGQNQELNVTSTETRTYAINGEEYEFEFVQGTRKQDNVAMRQVMGVIPGKAGAAFLMAFDTEENWDEAAITGMIESMGATLVEKSDEPPADGTAPEETVPPEAGAEAEAPGVRKQQPVPPTVRPATINEARPSVRRLGKLDDWSCVFLGTFFAW